MSRKRFIEETFPVAEVSRESAREKSIRHGHISTLHIWWARRPLAASRATALAALISAPNNDKEREEYSKFISKFSNWDNSLNERMIGIAKKYVLAEYGGTPPKILDPFGGGGSIPLEAQRIGCEVYSSDLNPVATLLQKCVLEFPQKYNQMSSTQGELIEGENILRKDVEKWSGWVLENARQEIEHLYPSTDEYSPVGYLWARTIPCQKPDCDCQIPLMRQFWLSRRENRKISLYPIIQSSEVKFKVIGDGYAKIPKKFKPSEGTVKGAVVSCPVCGNIIDPESTRRLFQEGKSGERLVAIILEQASQSGKAYRIATEEDVNDYQNGVELLQKTKDGLSDRWGISPIPDEALPPVGTLGFRIQRYGMTTWGDLFNTRQKLALLIFTKYVRESYNTMIEQQYDSDYAKIVTTYLSLILDRLVDKNASLVFYNVYGEKVEHVFARQALPIVWDYVEISPFTSVGWPNMTGWVLRIIEHLTSFSGIPGNVEQASADSLSYEDESFDAVFTDPPYYDNVPYSHLSDFFYVWLKRAIGHLYPSLFSTPLTPKSREIVAYPNREGGVKEAMRFFERNLQKSFQEIHRVLKNDGIAIIVYAHKSTEGWQTLINSLLDSGLVITGAWPIHTERSARLRARGSAALASSIYIVARKMKRESTGLYLDVRKELESFLNEKLDTLWKEGIGGADFFIAAIGAGIEVFGKYEKVIDLRGNQIRADGLLESVRNIATDYAVRQILGSGFSDKVSGLTRFYVLFRWNYRDSSLVFDEARKLAQSCGIDLTEHWDGSGFVVKKGEYIELLGPQDRKVKEIDSPDDIIDVLHKSLLLWEKEKRDDVTQLLIDTGYLDEEAFWRVAQAVSETLPIENKEKKLLDGFLVGRNGFQNGRGYVQEKLE